MNPLSHFTDTRPEPAGPRVLVSPFCKIIVRDHPETIVSFAAINCPPGKFNTSRIFANAPQNIVFLNCPRNAWYLDGIPGLGNSIEESADTLRTILSHLGIGDTRMLYWGGSMGGFGAVAFGALADAEMVVATGAELALLVEGGNSEIILIKRQNRVNIPEIPIESWVSRSRTRYHLYGGEFAYHDLVSAERVLRFSGVSMTTLKDFGHSLPGYLHEVYGLRSFLSDQFSSQKLFEFQHGEPGQLIQYRDWWRDLHAVSMNLPDGSRSRLEEGLRGNANLPPEVAGHCGHALSKGASLRGDHRAALDYAVEALRVAGPGRYLAFRHLETLRDNGAAPDVWLGIGRNLQDLDRPSRLEFGDQLVEMIVRGYRNPGPGLMRRYWGKWHAARFISRQKKKLPKKDVKRRQLLDRLASNSESSEIWKIGFTEQSSTAFSIRTLDSKEITVMNQRLIVSGSMLAPTSGGQLVSISMKPVDGLVCSSFLSHESPGLAAAHPGLPHAARARFKIDLELKPHGSDTVLISGKTADGQEIEWLTIKRSQSSV